MREMSVFFGSRKSGFFWVIFCALYPFLQSSFVCCSQNPFLFVKKDIFRFRATKERARRRTARRRTSSHRKELLLHIALYI